MASKENPTSLARCSASPKTLALGFDCSRKVTKNPRPQWISQTKKDDQNKVLTEPKPKKSPNFFHPPKKNPHNYPNNKHVHQNGCFFSPTKHRSFGKFRRPAVKPTFPPADAGELVSLLGGLHIDRQIARWCPIDLGSGMFYGFFCWCHL